jgi:hypothetical protein
MALRSRAKTSDTRIACARRAKRMMEMRLAGMKEADIAKKFGITQGRVSQILCREMDLLNEQRSNTTERLKRLEIERITTCLRGIWAKAKSGDYQAIDRVLAISDRLRKIHGLDPVDEPDAGPSQVVLNVQEMIVDRRGLERVQEANGDGDGDAATLEDGGPPSGPARLPAG